MKISPFVVATLLMLTTGCRVSSRMSVESAQRNINQVLADSNLDAGFIDEMKASQREMVAGLSGKDTINSTTLDRRWTDDERGLTRTFLSTLLEKSDLPTYTNSYETNKPSYSKPVNPLKGTNLYTVIPATIESNEYIIIGAHYDTVEESTGASDNASGCALVYGLGMAISRIEQRTKNIILIFFDQEERGLLGSISFADFVKQQGYLVHSVHTIDQVGWDEDGDKNVEIEKPDSELWNLYKSKSEEFNIKAYRTRVDASDHEAFRNAGFNAVGITEEYKHGDTSPHYHKMSDKFETVNFDYLAHTMLFVFSVIITLVN